MKAMMERKKTDLSKPGRENWVPDNAVSSCKECNAAFSWFTRKHHCRSCGCIFCDNCTKYRIQVKRSHYAVGEEKQKRACAACFLGKSQQQKNDTRPQALALRVGEREQLQNDDELQQPGDALVQARSGCHGRKPLQPRASFAARPSSAALLATAEEMEREIADCQSAAWATVLASRPQLAEAVRACPALVSPGNFRFENECERVFTELRRGLLSLGRHSKQHTLDKNSVVLLEELPGKRAVWQFLELVAARRPFYKAQVEEVGAVLQTSAQWKAAQSSRGA
eukprot:TRINITY_DN15663_c0_g1_i1.p1 TRINITY_DN15663_c0_g1~~TRINITY_DN15663_c0_g1_i1.p1  ORF type:complete len:282 (-),score=50.81 TRINITY_DN15663_c0_g1_i1:49-894(-)